MQAVIGHHTFDTANTDGVPGLLEFLGDYFDRGVRIQESMTDDLADDFVGAAVVGFGSTGLALKGGGALVGQQMAQLEVARLGITELARGGQGAKVGAFTFVDHGQFEGDFVVVGNLQLTRRAGEEVFPVFNGEHEASFGVAVSQEAFSGHSDESLIIYGGIRMSRSCIISVTFILSAT